MNVMAATHGGVPAGFRQLRLLPNAFIDANGPLFGRADGDRLVLGFRIEARHCNMAGICHGGMLMTFADMLIGVGTNYQTKLSRFLPTVSLACDFLAPGQLGAWIEGRTEVLRTTRSLAFAQALVSDGATPILRASGILKVGGEPDPRFRMNDLLD